MEIKSTTIIKLDQEERKALSDATPVLDSVFNNDYRSAVQFDVTKINIIDADDIAAMIRTLIELSDTGEPIGELLKL